MPPMLESVLQPAYPVPATAGIGWRGPHHEQLLSELPPVGWLEVHSENFFNAGERPLALLERAAAHYPLSLHGVGLSLGSTDPLDATHLAQLKRLMQRIDPALVSEHLCWGSIGGLHFNDLLPLPYTLEALSHLNARVQAVQESLGRRLLVENVSSYVEFRCSQLTEWDFLRELSQRSGCAILLDVNNVYVSSQNHGFDAARYIASMPVDAVQEVHLAGYSVNRVDGHEILIDSHSAVVSEPVWALYRQACARFPNCPTLIEWDTDLPPLATLVAQAMRADQERARAHVRAG